MSLRIACTLAVLCLSPLRIEAEIIETDRIEEVLPLIDEDTWFLVDLDNCMFQSAQALGHANWFYDEVEQRMQKGMTKEEAIRDAYPDWIKTQKVCRIKPLEEAFVPSLLSLQDKGIVVMGLTHRQPPVAEATFQQVASIGFDFRETAPFDKSLVLSADAPALYSRGILFVSDYNKKNEIFEQFLSATGQKPKKVVFIDDKRKYVEQLESLTSQDIDYVGIHYTAIQQAKPVYVKEVAAFQLKCLDQIISNEAALLLIENGLD